jgi:hypothetical protein
MLYRRTGTAAAVLLTLAAFVSQATAAELAAPKKTSTCTTYDHLPPVCGYVAQLTPDELNIVQGFHQQNVQAYQDLNKTIAPKKKPLAPLAAPTRTNTTCTTFDHFPAVCGYVTQLTADQLKVVESFHQKHVEAYQSFKNAPK